MQDAYPRCKFEVFLNFCGGDTRKHFTDFLYRSLVKAGIRTFKDDDGLLKGEDINKIFQAIEQCKISISILSTNYASREWCLRELAKMVECKNIRRQKILPIFYDIKPSVVREQSDCFEEALLKQEESFEEETIQKWKEALREVGSLTGWILDESFDGHQGKLVDDVVSTVWKELEKHKLLVLDHNIFGLDDMERNVMELLNVDADDVRIVGICGRAGSGKTILSKVIYNRISDKFERCSFLANVREKSQKHGLQYLQKQIICDIFKDNCLNRFHNIDDGIDIISQRFCTKKVLIVLDDIDQKEHLNALIVKPEWFGSGSRIILTTRNKDSLEDPKVYAFFEVMNPQQSLEHLLLTEIEDSGFYRNTDNILASIRQHETIKIGIYGIGGVGKSTLAMNVHDRLKCQSAINKVYWIPVSHDCSIHNLQQKIAKAIGLDLSGEDDQILRAAKLSKAFHKIRGFSLFLDDVWSYFPLESVGISNTMLGFKLILTSRSLEVCRSIGCNQCFKVDTLPDFETWNLFKNKIGHEMKLSSEIRSIAKSMTKKCAGLPLAIIAIASSMRGVDDTNEWRNALQILTAAKEGQRMMDLDVFPVLKLSYDRLKDTQLQQCFLFCAVYPEEHAIGRECLIDQFIDLGLINEANRETEFFRGHTILNNLENASLLERITSPIMEKYVRMHGLIRNMALRISKSKFMVKSDQSLHEPPDIEEWVCDLELVSLMLNDIKDVSAAPECPRLSTLIMNKNYNFSRMPDCFFMYLRGLRVLDLSYTSIVELPRSLGNLVDLTALILTCCTRLEKIPSLARLKSLRKLDLAYTAIEKVPNKVENMVKLRYLDLCCKNLKKFPVGILPKLTSIRHFKIIWPQGDIKVLKKGELRCLRKLEIFKVQFREWYEYEVFAKSSVRPERYHVILQNCVDPKDFSVEAPKGIFRAVEMRELFLPPRKDCILLPEDVQSIGLRYDCFRGSLGQFLSHNNVTNLEYCRIFHYNQMESLLSLSLPIQRSRGLWPMAQQVQPSEAFSHLKCLIIISCYRIRRLIGPGLCLYLRNLEVLILRSCYDLQGIIDEDDNNDDDDEEEEEEEDEDEDEDDDSEDEDEIMALAMSAVGRDNHTVSLPKLRRIELEELPKLRRISKTTLNCESLQEVDIHRCPRLKRMPRSLRLRLSCPSFRGSRDYSFGMW